MADFSNAASILTKKTNSSAFQIDGADAFVNGVVLGNGDALSSPLALFDAEFGPLVETLFIDMPADLRPITERFREVCHYNVPFGKKYRGLILVETYRCIAGDSLTEAGLKQARILGWCVEFLQAFCLMADDIMDNSKLRRGRPCWYLTETASNAAINDSFYVEQAVYKILRSNFHGTPHYMDLVDLFRQMTEYTMWGQGLDLSTNPLSGSDFSLFTRKQYKLIVTWKTAFYSFYLPVAAAMILSGISLDQTAEHAAVKEVLLPMGESFQARDDFLDCFGDSSVTGKIGTDIQEGKCTWLVVEALLLVNDRQKDELMRSYGKNDPAKIAIVEQLYKELQLDRLYERFEEKCYIDLCQRIESYKGSVPRLVFHCLLEKIYKRSK